MKLNKKLLTAALAGALIVTAVPANTFAAEKAPKITENLSEEQAAAKIAELSAEIKTLSERRAEIVAQPWASELTQEGIIEKLQAEETAKKKAYEGAKAAYESATKAWEAAKDAQEKARLAKIEADKKAKAAQGDYYKAIKEAEKERDAAKKAAKEAYDTTIANLQRKFESATAAADKALIELNSAKEALDSAKKSGSNEEQLTRLRKEVEEKELAHETAKNLATRASNERADAKSGAEKALAAAENQADENFQAKKQYLDKKYILSGGWNGSAADLTKLERERLAAIDAYNNAVANTKAAHDAYISARDAFDAASKEYAAATQRTYKITEELKSIEKQLKEKFVTINAILKDQNKGINSLADQLNSELIKELEEFSKLSSSEQFAKIAKLQEELAKLKKEYAKTSEGIQQVKKLVTYQFHVKDTEGKGVQGLTLRLANIDDTSKVYTATSDANGLIQFKSMVEGKYSVTVTKVPTGYDVYQDGKKIDSVKALFRAESEVKAENNAEETKKEETKGNKRVDIPSIIDNTTEGNGEKEEKDNKDEKVIDKGTIVVEKKKKDNKDNKDNKKPEKKETKKPAKPAKQRLPKAGAAAEAATIAAAAMATMGGAYLSLKKRK
ncbi:cell wall protein [Finegoldia magna ALB8]|uniref:adhesion factor FAF n=1 Tax=Finegoldia magna TaxID=1260 RepID=UPI000451FDBF|nr:adhesion factor FAF [Finegoldia magna]EXF27121.1 cell wall protein [Finegoldia magna ALB8]